MHTRWILAVGSSKPNLLISHLGLKWLLRFISKRKSQPSAVSCYYSPPVWGSFWSFGCSEVGFCPWAHRLQSAETTLQKTLRGHAEMISLSLSLSVSFLLHVSPPLTAYLNHAKSPREADLIWQPSEKTQGCEHVEINWFIFLSNVWITCFLLFIFLFCSSAVNQTKWVRNKAIASDQWGILLLQLTRKSPRADREDKRLHSLCCG